ncbi:MAG: ThiF family adenylyltransferase [Kiritimatiellae bacterium]|nr:ThiF family adenylyltransferase [Kiritimatiellia bacterium]
MDTPYERTIQLFGRGAVERLRRARVLVAGLGAVGAAAAESLARTAVGTLVLADFDVIRPSNLNRHPFAFHSTLGQPKTAAAARFLRDIDPAVRIEIAEGFIDAETAPRLLAEHPSDVLVDAIDSLLPKTELLLAAQAAGHPCILSAMGAARKTDPLRLAEADLLDTTVCPLAQLLRKRLRRRGVRRGIRCVYSLEPASAPALPADPDPAPDYLDRGRRRPPMGSLHAVTSAAGAALAAAAIRHLLAPEAP